MLAISTIFALSISYEHIGTHYMTVFPHCPGIGESRCNGSSLEMHNDACVWRQYLNPDPMTVSLVPPAVLPLLGDTAVMSGVSDTAYVNGVIDCDKSFPLTTLTSQACSAPVPMRGGSD